MQTDFPETAKEIKTKAKKIKNSFVLLTFHKKWWYYYAQNFYV